MVVVPPAFFESLVQLPPPPTQAQDRLKVALPVMQRFVWPNPAKSTLTPNGVVVHEKSFSFIACAELVAGARHPRISEQIVVVTVRNFISFSS